MSGRKWPNGEHLKSENIVNICMRLPGAQKSYLEIEWICNTQGDICKCTERFGKMAQVPSDVFNSENFVNIHIRLVRFQNPFGTRIYTLCAML